VSRLIGVVRAVAALVGLNHLKWFDSLDIPKTDQVSRLLVTFFVMGLLRGRYKIVDDVFMLVRNSVYLCDQDFPIRTGNSDNPINTGLEQLQFIIGHFKLIL